LRCDVVPLFGYRSRIGMTGKKQTFIGMTVVVFTAVWCLLAAPKIDLKETEKDMGEIKEGTTEKVSYEFVIHNTGKDTVRIQNVKPG